MIIRSQDCSVFEKGGAAQQQKGGSEICRVQGDWGGGGAGQRKTHKDGGSRGPEEEQKVPSPLLKGKMGASRGAGGRQSKGKSLRREEDQSSGEKENALTDVAKGKTFIGQHGFHAGAFEKKGVTRVG